MITPESLAASGTEHGHQCAFMQWAALSRNSIEDIEMLYAVPNGGDRSPSVGAKMKAEGLKPGVPDMVWPVPLWQYAGLYMELKLPKHYSSKNGGASDKQLDWHRKLLAKRYAVALVYGWEAMRDALLAYRAGSMNIPRDATEAVRFR